MNNQYLEKNNNDLFVWLILLVAYSYLLYFLSSSVVTIPGPRFPLKDKVLHFGAYGVMAWLAWQVLRRWTEAGHGFWAWLYAAVYGATDEWHQYYVPGRYADVWDWVADITGAALTLLAANLWLSYRQKQDWKADTKAHYE